MKFLGLILTGTLFAVSAHAGLADEYESRGRETAAQIEAENQAVLTKSIYKNIEGHSKSKIIGAPEIRAYPNSTSLQRWYFQMKNGQICSVPVTTNGQGLLVYVWGQDVDCR